jgi:hypothetical protein
MSDPTNDALRAAAIQILNSHTRFVRLKTGDPMQENTPDIMADGGVRQYTQVEIQALCEKSFRAGQVDEACARNANIPGNLLSVRDTLSALARQDPTKTDTELVLALARIYCNKAVRKSYRLGGKNA